MTKPITLIIYAAGILRRLRDAFNGIFYSGSGRLCPVCGKTSRSFGMAGIERRANARCMHCRCLERDRLVWQFFVKKTDLFDGKPKKILHVAPERSLSRRLKSRLGSGYVTADLNNPEAMVKMDITNIRYPDQSFDVIYCSHVLEHITDDARALSELHRVLKDHGWALIQVPIVAEKTEEFENVKNDSERLRLYGHYEHVRNYGPDYIDRLRSAKFNVLRITREEVVDEKTRVIMGINEASGDIFFCRKRPD